MHTIRVLRAHSRDNIAGVVHGACGPQSAHEVRFFARLGCGDHCCPTGRNHLNGTCANATSSPRDQHCLACAGCNRLNRHLRGDASQPQNPSAGDGRPIRNRGDAEAFWYNHILAERAVENIQPVVCVYGDSGIRACLTNRNGWIDGSVRASAERAGIIEDGGFEVLVTIYDVDLLNAAAKPCATDRAAASSHRSVHSSIGLAPTNHPGGVAARRVRDRGT